MVIITRMAFLTQKLGFGQEELIPTMHPTLIVKIHQKEDKAAKNPRSKLKVHQNLQSMTKDPTNLSDKLSDKIRRVEICRTYHRAMVAKQYSLKTLHKPFGLNTRNTWNQSYSSLQFLDLLDFSLFLRLSAQEIEMLNMFIRMSKSIAHGTRSKTIHGAPLCSKKKSGVQWFTEPSLAKSLSPLTAASATTPTQAIWMAHQSRRNKRIGCAVTHAGGTTKRNRKLPRTELKSTKMGSATAKARFTQSTGADTNRHGHSQPFNKNLKSMINQYPFTKTYETYIHYLNTIQ